MDIKYDYIMINCDAIHIAIYCDIQSSSLKMKEQMQVTVYDLGSLHTSHLIVFIH